MKGFLIEEAKEYRKIAIESICRNTHMHKVNQAIDQDVIDAVLVDFLNYLASKRCVDLALYPVDLQDLPLSDTIKEPAKQIDLASKINTASPTYNM